MSGSVMLWGLPADGPTASLMREFARRDVPYFLVDQRRPLHLAGEVTSQAQVAARLEVDGRAIQLEDVRSVYARQYEARAILERPQSNMAPADVACSLHTQEMLFAWTDVTDTLVVNRPSAMVSNGSKPYQVELIRRHGFAVPPTLVTNDPSMGREFVARYPEVICKSVSAVRSKVARLSSEQLHRIDEIANCPTQLQEHIQGTDWRVHVIGDDVYPCTIRSECDDYRYAVSQGAELAIEAAGLAPDVADRCQALVHSLRLCVAGIDLRRTPAGEWYCFEVNPSPVLTYYECHTEQPLTQALASLLITGKCIDGGVREALRIPPAIAVPDAIAPL